MKKLLILASVCEALTGLVLLVYPPIVIRLLFGSEIVGAAVLVSRFAGISLIALSVACWPDSNMRQAFFGMLSYGVLATLYLVYLGLNGRAGILLWPAVVLHAALSALLVWAWRKQRQAPEANTQISPAPNQPEAQATKLKKVG
jgi:hypothetical protein